MAGQCICERLRLGSESRHGGDGLFQVGGGHRDRTRVAPEGGQCSLAQDARQVGEGSTRAPVYEVVDVHVVGEWNV